MKTTTFVLLLAIALSACTPVSQKMSGDIDTLFQTWTKQGLFSGSVLIAQKGQVILSKGYGFADQEKKISNTPQTRFLIASITKQFTAMAIMMLQEKGKLNVQDKICTYLSGCPEAWKPITIHQLLTHTSGIHDTIGVYSTKDLTSSLALEQEIAAAKTSPVDFQPSEKFSYDNMGYNLLGKIIEAISGQSYEAFLQKNIFDPVKMSNTGYYHNQGDLAIGYNNPYSVADPMNMWGHFSAGALYSTVEDLYRWDQALYTNKLVPQKVLDTMFTAYVVMPDSNSWGYGYGWMIGPDKQRVIMHPGSLSGYGSLIKRYLDDKVTVIILSNRGDLDPELNSDIVMEKFFGK